MGYKESTGATANEYARYTLKVDKDDGDGSTMI